MLENRTVLELWVLANKVRRSSELSILLFDRLMEFADRASPEVISLPYQVKFIRSLTLQTMNLDPEGIKKYAAMQLVKTEHMLRTKGFATPEKLLAADVIQAYCTERIPRYQLMKNRLRPPRVQPVLPPPLSTEGDRILDPDIIANLPDLEEGEMREGDARD